MLQSVYLKQACINPPLNACSYCILGRPHPDYGSGKCPSTSLVKETSNTRSDRMVNARSLLSISTSFSQFCSCRIC